MSKSPTVRILFIIDYFHRTGGTETHLALLVQWLAAAGFHCEVVVFDLGQNDLIEQIRTAGVTVHHLPVAREYSPNALRQAWRLARLVRQGRFDVVQTFHQKSDTYGAVVARLAGVRHLVSSKRDTGHLRRPHHFFLNRRLRFLFQRIIVVADAVAAAVIRSDHIDPARVVKIYNGVDSNKFIPASPAQAQAARARFGLTDRDLVVGMVAGFRPEKDHRMLLEGALAARSRLPDLKVLLVGDGPLLAPLRAQYEAAGFVTFAGDVRDVWNVLMAMDIGCLLPSSNEGFSNAIVEKMAAGLPIIATDMGGNAEAVVAGENGYIIPPGDVPALVSALVGLGGDPAQRVKMGRRSREYVEEKFSLQQMCGRHARLYRELCGVAAADVE